MSYHHILLIFHLLAAAIWVGGHLLLLVSYVPGALRHHNKQVILDFEKHYERVGLPSLAVLVGTGIAMAADFGIGPGYWFHFEAPLERVISLKLLLLLANFALALSAQLNVIPRLKRGSNNLLPLVWHIGLVTAIGVLMLVLGSFIRFGGV